MPWRWLELKLGFLCVWYGGLLFLGCRCRNECWSSMTSYRDRSMLIAVESEEMDFSTSN